MDPPKEPPSNFCKEMMKPLVVAYRPLAGMFGEIFERSLDKKMEPVVHEIVVKDIQSKNLDRDDKVRILEMKVDDLQQKERENNVIITGLGETDANIEGVRRCLNGKAGTALSLYIKTMIKLLQYRLRKWAPFSVNISIHTANLGRKEIRNAKIQLLEIASNAKRAFCNPHLKHKLHFSA